MNPPKKFLAAMAKNRVADLVKRARSVYVHNRSTGQVATQLVPGPTFTARDASDLKAYTSRGWFRSVPSFQIGA